MAGEIAEMLMQEQLADNIAQVRATIAEAAQRVGRRAEEITLVAVSKTFPVEFVKMAYNLGVTHLVRIVCRKPCPRSLNFILMMCAGI